MIDSPTIRCAILNNLLSNTDFSVRVLPHIKADYFVEPFEKIIFEEISKYQFKYNNLPSPGELQISIESRSDLNETSFKSIRDFLDNPPKPVNNTKALVDFTEKWAKERAVTLAVLQAVAVIGGESNIDLSANALPRLLGDALAVSFDKSIGTSWLDDAERRHTELTAKHFKVHTNLRYLDDITGGGLDKKTLSIFMAGPNVGKSLMMTSLAGSVVLQGKKVLYISLEMSEARILQRIDQNIMNLTRADIEGMSTETFKRHVENTRERVGEGMVIAKEYATGTANANHFRALLEELAATKNFRPDIIFIDYLNICGCAGANRNTSDHNKVKMIAEEVRAIAVEYEVPIVSATQMNREGLKAGSNADITHTSESMGLPATADYMFRLVTNEQLHNMNMIGISCLKNRNGDKRMGINDTLSVDYRFMRVTDCLGNEHAQNDVDYQKYTSNQVSVNKDVKWN